MITNRKQTREALRERGQFWTPAWVAEAMVEYAVAGGDSCIFDPAVGAAAFFQAAKKIARETNRRIELRGTEIDNAVLAEAARTGLTPADLAGVELCDFVLDPPPGRFSAIVANPPYIRHHRLTKSVKIALKALGRNVVGSELDGRAGLHVFFLVRSLELLAPGGRLAFIVPADICEGVFAPALWDWIGRRFRLDAVVTFESDAAPFPGIDTNPLVLMIRNAVPAPAFHWVRCLRSGEGFRRGVAAGFETDESSLSVRVRSLEEGLATGLSRGPSEIRFSNLVLGDLAFVMRGVATGANAFFFLTAARAAELGIGDRYLVPAIGRTRDVRGDDVTDDLLRALANSGRPTRLLSLDGRDVSGLPAPVRAYLAAGERIGLHKRPLISTRKPWYRMEVREPPPILFAYLGRRRARFIRNRAGVVPLTGFLCVYPKERGEQAAERLWKVLSHPETGAGLRLVAKSYGGGAIKVEPRGLERLPIPEVALSRVK
jgi:hypothetical protein